LFSDQDLVALLQQCYEKNARLGITGMLLYKDGNFIQVLEGPEISVKQVYRSILNDQRHHGAIRLLEEGTERRRFPDWSMGFRNLRDADLKEVPAYTDFLDMSLKSPIFQSDPSRAQKLLLIFRGKN
jgi:hypothetical protein